ncbi:MAG: methionyl-tRNA formyltransferase [Eubacterium sp.]
MALLKKDSFDRIEKNRNTIHKAVRASYTDFLENDSIVFQIDTYGTAGRAMPEKASQSLQINKDMAVCLIDLLQKTFKLN